MKRNIILILFLSNILLCNPSDKKLAIGLDIGSFDFGIIKGPDFKTVLFGFNWNFHFKTKNYPIYTYFDFSYYWFLGGYRFGVGLDYIKTIGSQNILFKIGIGLNFGYLLNIYDISVVNLIKKFTSILIGLFGNSEIKLNDSVSAFDIKVRIPINLEFNITKIFSIYISYLNHLGVILFFDKKPAFIINMQVGTGMRFYF